MRHDWHGILKILEIKHFSADNEIIWEDKNIYNILHTDGEEFILKSTFIGGSDSAYIPTNYYFGLDSRSTISASDTMADIENEPSTNGYVRQAVASLNKFTLILVGGINQARSPIITFSASGGSWGPVLNLFITDKIDNSGLLIASAALSQSTTLSSGQSVSMRMGLSLRDCP
jgi:hypothetical protein